MTAECLGPYPETGELNIYITTSAVIYVYVVPVPALWLVVMTDHVAVVRSLKSPPV